MGNKQEMVVAVRAPEGKQGLINVTLTTDVAQDLFLHWGVRKQGGGDWVAPPKVELTRLQRTCLLFASLAIYTLRVCECTWGKQGPINVTNVAQNLFSHLGIRKRQGGGDRLAPPKVQNLHLS